MSSTRTKPLFQREKGAEKGDKHWRSWQKVEKVRGVRDTSKSSKAISPAANKTNISCTVLTLAVVEKQSSQPAHKKESATKPIRNTV